jgi:adenylosuccinate lyase
VETLPELITLVGGALAQSEALVREMQVFPHKMRADLDITHGLIMAEAVTWRWRSLSAKPRPITGLRRCVARRWMGHVRC